MIEINDRFKIKRESDCWTLIEFRNGINPRTKEPTITEHRSWYPYLHQLVSEIVERAPGGAADLQEMLFKVEQVRNDIYRALTRPVVQEVE